MAARAVRKFLPMNILIPLEGKTREIANMLRHGAGLIAPGPGLAVLARGVGAPGPLSHEARGRLEAPARHEALSRMFVCATGYRLLERGPAR